VEDEGIFLFDGDLYFYESQNKGHHEDNLGHGIE
jgi:hypothetical protein